MAEIPGEVAVGKITYTFGDGTYTFTQQRRNAAGNAWEAVPANAGVVDGTVTDINGSTDGSVDDLVQFWLAHGLAGNSIYACDVSEGGGSSQGSG